ASLRRPTPPPRRPSASSAPGGSWAGIRSYRQQPPLRFPVRRRLPHRDLPLRPVIRAQRAKFGRGHASAVDFHEDLATETPHDPGPHPGRAGPFDPKTALRHGTAPSSIAFSGVHFGRFSSRLLFHGELCATSKSAISSGCRCRLIFSHNAPRRREPFSTRETLAWFRPTIAARVFVSRPRACSRR